MIPNAQQSIPAVYILEEKFHSNMSHEISQGSLVTDHVPARAAR